MQVLDVDLSRERISLSLKATQQDPWQEFATTHQVGELVYGRVTKLVPFGAFVQVGDGIEGLVHISEMAVHHVEAPEQVVTPGEELWVKIIDIDLDRRRISLSIKQAAEGGIVAAEYQDQFGEHAYDEEGNYIGPDYTEEEAAEGAEGLPSKAPRRPQRAEAVGSRGRRGRGRAGGSAPPRRRRRSTGGRERAPKRRSSSGSTRERQLRRSSIRLHWPVLLLWTGVRANEPTGPGRRLVQAASSNATSHSKPLRMRVAARA